MQVGQFSFLMVLALLSGLIIAQTWPKRRLRLIGIGLAALLIMGWWLLRPGAGGSGTEQSLEGVMAQGKPVVVEVYSDY